MSLRGVRDVASRWVGRARASRQVLMILFFGMTGLSTFTNVARDYLTTTQLITVDGGVVVGVIIFMYLGDKLNFFVHQQRNLQDIQNNFLNPQGAMVQIFRAQQLKLLGKYMKGEIDKDEYEKEIDEKTRELINKYKNGINWKDKI